MYLHIYIRHDAVIDEEIWKIRNKVCLERKETNVKWNKVHDLNHKHLLAGILRCPICDASLAGTIRRKKMVRSVISNRCLTRLGRMTKQ